VTGWMLPIGLLIVSNLFMTLAWYGHLKFKSAPLVATILVSWGIALLEYCFQVPANRIGSQYFTASQLKTIQEIITFGVFILFSMWFLKEPFRWNVGVGFVVMIFGAYIVLRK